MDLLIERYHVPDVLTAFNIENINSLTAKRKEDIKRYRKQYYQPIQFRYVYFFTHNAIDRAIKAISIYFYLTDATRKGIIINVSIFMYT